MILENLYPQKITLEQIKDAIKAGYTPKVVINGEWYILELQEVTKLDDNQNKFRNT